jgi:hypothetical protein
VSFIERNSFHNGYFSTVHWEIFNLALVKMLNYLMLFAIWNFISLRLLVIFTHLKIEYFTVEYCTAAAERVHWERLLLLVVGCN